MFDKFKENLREAVTGSNPSNDLRARLHADHVEVDRLIHRLESTEERAIARRAELREELVQALTVHARAEEEVVYNQLGAASELRHESSHLEREHEQINQALAAVEVMDPSEPGFFDALTDLKEIVKHHVHREENEVLPRAERTLGHQYLAAMIPAFNERKRDLLQQRMSALARTPTEPEPTPTPTPSRSSGMMDSPSYW